MSRLCRIMIRGEDGMVWCEINHKTLDWCENNGDTLCSEYENAQWWIENDEPDFFNSDIDDHFV